MITGQGKKVLHIRRYQEPRSPGTGLAPNFKHVNSVYKHVISVPVVKTSSNLTPLSSTGDQKKLPVRRDGERQFRRFGIFIILDKRQT